MFDLRGFLSEAKTEEQALLVNFRAKFHGLYSELRGDLEKLTGNKLDWLPEDTHWNDAADHKIADTMVRAGVSVPMVVPTSAAVSSTLPPDQQKQIISVAMGIAAGAAGDPASSATGIGNINHPNETDAAKQPSSVVNTSAGETSALPSST